MSVPIPSQPACLSDAVERIVRQFDSVHMLTEL